MTVNAMRKPNGEAAAAIVSAAVGCLVLGLLTVGAELSEGLRANLILNPGVGPLSGKTAYAVVAYLIAWGGLHFMWKGKSVDLTRWLMVSWVLIGLGFLLTFPPVFTAFHSE